MYTSLVYTQAVSSPQTAWDTRLRVHTRRARGGGGGGVGGVLLGEVLDRCKLTSCCEAVSGPDYTYHSGNSSTAVDYILADVEASSCVESCEVLEDTDLNICQTILQYL